MIQIDHVTFSYGEETEHTGGVRDIELQIKRGELCSAARAAAEKPRSHA